MEKGVVSHSESRWSFSGRSAADFVPPSSRVHCLGTRPLSSDESVFSLTPWSLI